MYGTLYGMNIHLWIYRSQLIQLWMVHPCSAPKMPSGSWKYEDGEHWRPGLKAGAGAEQPLPASYAGHDLTVLPHWNSE